MHDELAAGHLAFQRTYLKVKSHYYWPGILKEIKEYCTTCEICAANTKCNRRAALHPHEAATAPFQVVGVDFMGPIRPASPYGNSYIMVMTDYFSKWVEAVAVPNTSAETTCDCFYRHIVQRHGPPKAIVSDRGSNFTAKLFRSFCRQFNIEQRLTTAYNPASNGATERQNRTLISMLRKLLIDSTHDNWEDYLDEVCFAYRASIHSSTLESPYYLLHGRDPNMLINQFLNTDPEPVRSNSDYLGTLRDRLHYSFHRVRRDAAKARQHQKEQYDKRAVDHPFQVGDKVLLDVRVVKPEDSKKFTSKFEGPYRILKIFNNNTAVIVNSAYAKQHVHFNRLKPLLETMLWRDEACPKFSFEEFSKRFRKTISVQTESSSTEVETDPPDTFNDTLEFLPPLSPLQEQMSPREIYPDDSPPTEEEFLFSPPRSPETHPVNQPFFPSSPPTTPAASETGDDNYSHLTEPSQSPQDPPQRNRPNLRQHGLLKRPARFKDFMME